MDYNLNDRHCFFILIDKGVELSEFINVYNVDYEYNDGSLWEPPYENFDYEIEIDEEFYQYIHLVNYAYYVGYNDVIENNIVKFMIDKQEYNIPEENSDEQFDMFVQAHNLAYPIESELDGWWNNAASAIGAIDQYVRNVAKNKAEDILNDPYFGKYYDC